MVRRLLLRLCEGYFRHRWLYWLPCLLMVIAAYFYCLTLPATYITHGTLYVQDKTLLSSLTALQQEGYTWITPAQATVNEVSELLNSKAFIRAVVASTDLEFALSKGPNAVESTLEEARTALWVQSLGDNLVMISAVHERPRVTHQLVNGAIEAYILWKINLTHNDSAAAQKFFTDLLVTYQAEVDTARQALATYLAVRPRPVHGERPDREMAEITRLQTVVDQAEARLRNAQDQEEQARLTLIQTESDVRQSYSLVDAPVQPSAPERALKSLLLALLMFLGAGVGLSITAIVGGALLDQSFYFPLEVPQALGLPVLAVVPEATVPRTVLGRQPPNSHPTTTTTGAVRRRLLRWA